MKNKVNFLEALYSVNLFQITQRTWMCKNETNPEKWGCDNFDVFR